VRARRFASDGRLSVWLDGIGRWIRPDRPEGRSVLARKHQRALVEVELDFVEWEVGVFDLLAGDSSLFPSVARARPWFAWTFSVQTWNSSAATLQLIWCDAIRSISQ
jgi:hypothetical protein